MVAKQLKRFFEIFSHTSLAVKNLMRFREGIGEEFKIHLYKETNGVYVS